MAPRGARRLSAIRVVAHAKVNLSLEVIGRRPDGYHELVSVFQAISLADTLICRPAATLSLVAEPPLALHDNLALRAAHLLRAHAGVAEGASLTLRKRIPVAAGLGGGSADAAAALVALAHLWRLKGPALVALAAELGSDVPFFLGHATSLVRGRGERVTRLPSPPPRSVVFVRPTIPLSTAAVFAALSPEEWSDGTATMAIASSLEAGRELPDDMLTNALLGAAERCCPPLAELRSALLAAGLRPHLSGSGPTMFVLADDSSVEPVVGEVAQRLGCKAWTARTIRSRPVRAHSRHHASRPV